MKKLKLLIADDYTDNRMLLAQIAELLSLEYVLVENGKQACDAILADDQINIAFLDIEMPVMNGVEAVKAIRSMTYPRNSMPVVAITAHAPEHFKEKLQKSGFNNYITKPYTMDKVQSVLSLYF